MVGLLHKKILFLGSVLVLGMLVISSCSMDKETTLSQNRVQVQQEKFLKEIPVASLDSAVIADISKYYRRHGDGAVDLTVTYDPASRKSTALSASNDASRIVKDFRKNGVIDIQPNILPVQKHDGVQMAIISFTSYIAKAPKDCSLLPGMESRDVYVDEDYKLGCTIETVFSRQIARPKDLKGRPNTDPTSSGRRASNVVEDYRTGVPNEPMGGESASGN